MQSDNANERIGFGAAILAWRESLWRRRKSRADSGDGGGFKSAGSLPAGGTDEGLEVGDGSGPIDAMTEVDDVPLSAASRHAAARRLGHLRRRPFLEQLLIDVALKRQLGMLAPCLGQIVTCAETDYIGAG